MEGGPRLWNSRHDYLLVQVMMDRESEATPVVLRSLEEAKRSTERAPETLRRVADDLEAWDDLVETGKSNCAENLLQTAYLLYDKAEKYQDEELKESAEDILYCRDCLLGGFHTPANAASYASFVRDLRQHQQGKGRRRWLEQHRATAAAFPTSSSSSSRSKRSREEEPRHKGKGSDKGKGKE